MSANGKTKRMLDQVSDSVRLRAPEKIFHEIRMEIACGVLKPRERLIEHELCERFKTSNHNIRQAFELLDRIGLIDRRPNRGVEVKALSSTELNDLYEVRVLLQLEGARRIDSSKAVELGERLTKINCQYEAALKSGNLAEAFSANDAFHMATFDYCTNSDLADLQRTYWLKASAVISHALIDRSLSDRSVAYQRSIISAISDGDLHRFSKIAVRHILPAFEAYSKIYGLEAPVFPRDLEKTDNIQVPLNS